MSTKLRRTKVSVVGDITTYLLLALYASFMALPLIYSVAQAFKPYNELFIFPPRFLPKEPTMMNFKKLFDLTSTAWVPFSRYVFNTILNTVVGTVIHILSAAMAAYPLAKNRFPGKKGINKVIVWSLLFAGGVTEIPVYLVMSKLGIIDTYFAFWLPELSATMGVFLLRQNIAQIPNAVIEAARIDGAEEWKILWSIVMPAVKPAWLTLAIFSFQRNWNATATSYIYTETLKTLPSALSQITAAGSVARAGEAYAASILLMVPPIIFFILAQSSTVKTMAHAGIKG
ncbi:MAG: carbohydrate ABC transporter permease [Clostridia bacterium]|nr:carbohydrate ABC transporter permease [Clostridia bacterium]